MVVPILEIPKMLLSAKQLALMLDVTPQCISKNCRDGRIQDAQLIGGTWVIRWSEFLAASLSKKGNLKRRRGRYS
jgi:hypothetical protein